MEEAKIIFDVLASVASVVAIVTVLVGWYRSSRRALAIDRVVIHRKSPESTYILIVRNRKDYPVEIKTTNCYTRISYNIEKKGNQKPEFSKLLNLEDSIFRDKTKITIGPTGNTDIRIKGPSIDGRINKIKKLLFSINTSHGYHEVWCKKF